MTDPNLNKVIFAFLELVQTLVIPLGREELFEEVVILSAGSFINPPASEIRGQGTDDFKVLGEHDSLC